MLEKKVTVDMLRTELQGFPQVKFESAKKEHINKLLEHINNAQVKICKSDEIIPYCRTDYVVISVYYHLSEKLTLKLVEKRRSSSRERVRPMEGINTKIFLGEMIEHAAHRALREKLGIARFEHLERLGSNWDKLKIGSGIPGLYTKNLLYNFNFHMQKNMYDGNGYTIRRGTNKEVQFEWIPVRSRVTEEIQILP